MPSRRRLTPQRRRKEILDAAERLFAASLYDDVAMDHVAAEAGVSRALLYRYFPGKRELFATMYRRDADRLVGSPAASPGPLIHWVASRLEAHIDYFLAHPHAVMAANEALRDDPVVRGIVEGELNALRDSFLDAAELDGATRDVVAAILASWLEFVRVLSLEWLGARTSLHRQQFRDVCLQALLGALSSRVDVAGPAGA